MLGHDILQAQHRVDDLAQGGGHLRVARVGINLPAGVVELHEARVERRPGHGCSAVGRHQHAVLRHLDVGETRLGQILLDRGHLGVGRHIGGENLVGRKLLTEIRAARLIDLPDKRLKILLVAQFKRDNDVYWFIGGHFAGGVGGRLRRRQCTIYRMIGWRGNKCVRPGRNPVL